MSKFRFSADIIRRLGEELNPGMDQSILELVKNSYDADATECIVKLSSAESVGGTLEVSDNGSGMNPEQIENAWLVLGRSNKIATVQTPKYGRLPAGSKGLGRLAALRSGDRAIMETRPASNRSNQFSLTIDWKKFDRANLVDDIEFDIRKTKRAIKNSGTTILIKGLKEKVSRDEMKRVARGLILLADPFITDNSGFNPRLIAPEFDDLEELVKKRYFHDADLHLIARVDSKGQGSASVVDWRGKTIFRGKHEDITSRRDKSPYFCPEAEFDLWVFLLDAASFSHKTITIGEVRDWLNNFGGVHVYQNSLRVSPYGNEGVDWLDLNRSRVRSPEERPGTNTSIGKVSIKDPQSQLTQKTDRSGFIENESFVELRRFAKDALEWMAAERMRVAEIRRQAARKKAPSRSAAASQNLAKAIEQAPDKLRKKLEEAQKTSNEAHSREVAMLQKEVQLYRTLSTAGITAATFAHESQGNPVKIIKLAIGTIDRRSSKLSSKDWEDLFAKPVTLIQKAVQSLSVLGKATLNLLDNEKRRRGRVDIKSVTENLLETFEPFTDGRDVKIIKDPWPQESPHFLGSDAALEVIITNLLNNALSAIEDSGIKNRTIRIGYSIQDSFCLLTITDSGNGISGIKVSDIWLPGRTTRKNGTGLGLTIVRDTVSDLGGTVRAVAKSKTGGAEITVKIPIIPMTHEH